MRALTLDFRRASRFRWLGMAVLASGVAGAALLGANYRQLLDEQARLEGSLRKAAGAARKLEPAAGATGDARKVALEVERARKLLRELDMPWDELFASVEGVDMRQVGLLSVETDIDRQVVKIDAEAKDLRAMLRYLGEMETRPAFESVYLQSHQVQLQDAQRPVRFVLTAKWRVSR